MVKLTSKSKNREYSGNSPDSYYARNREALIEKKKQAYRLNKAPHRDRCLRKNYNLSLKEYERLLGQQHGVCAICRQPQSRRNLCVDHCHKTGKIRGLLCDSCNLVLGKFKDNGVLFMRTIKYLVKDLDFYAG